MEPIPILYNDDPAMPMGLRKELAIIQDALLKIDFQINDDDKPDFYNYVLNELYGIGGDYANPDFVPKKYFKVLLGQIKKTINWSEDFVKPHTDN
jgi:hypothetical protein